MDRKIRALARALLRVDAARDVAVQRVSEQSKTDSAVAYTVR